MQKQEILELIKNNRLHEALIQMEALAINKQNKTLQRAVILEASRYKQLVENEQDGTLTLEEVRVQKTKINKRLLTLTVDAFTEESKDKGFQSRTLPINKKRVFYLFLIAAFLTSIVILISKVYSKQPFDLTIYVHGSKGQQEVVLEGKGRLYLDLGGDRRTALIGEHGRTNFSEIPSKFSNMTLSIGLEEKDYELTEPNKLYPLNGTPIYLEVRKAKSNGLVQGVVKSRDGNSFISEALINIGADTVVKADEFGRFKVQLPEAMYQDQYFLTISKPGYESVTEYYYPDSQPLQVRLDKIKETK